jgi:hypothetical protein
MNYFKESVFKPLGDYFVETNKNGDMNLDDYLDAMFQHDPTFQINLAKELFENYGKKDLAISGLNPYLTIEKYGENPSFIKKLLLAGAIEKLDPEWKNLLKNGIDFFKKEIIKFNDGIDVLNLFKNLNLFEGQETNFKWWAYFESQLKNDNLESRLKGVEGEMLSLRFEELYLKLHKIDSSPEPTFFLNSNVGYDIKSTRKDTNGTYFDIFIEAKFSLDKRQPYFYLSRNEFNVLKEKKQNYFVYFWNVHTFANQSEKIYDVSRKEIDTDMNLHLIKADKIISNSPQDSSASYWEKSRFDVINF